MTLDEELKRAQLEKLRTELRLIEHDFLAAPRRQRRVRWLDNLKLTAGVVVGVAGMVTAGFQYQANLFTVSTAKAANSEAFKKRDQAIEEAKRAESARQAAVQLRQQEEARTRQIQENLERFKDTAARQEQVLLKVAPQDVGSRLVYVQFRGGLKRELIDGLRKELKRNNFDAPGAEREPGTYGNEIRYFSASDLETATRLRVAVDAFFARAGCPTEMKLASSPSAQGEASPLEVWISHSCPASRAES